MDGVDAVLVCFDNDKTEIIGHLWQAMPNEIKSPLLALNEPNQTNEIHQGAILAQKLSFWFANTCKALCQQTNKKPNEIKAIGCHGQTIRHQPLQGYSLQLINGALLAEQTEITVITDFRSRDIAAGGQGAPLVPAFHQAVLSHPSKTRFIINLGGFANITLLEPDTTALGYDTGPANVLMDAWINRHRQQPYDPQGQWASTGEIIPELLADWLRHPFFKIQPPKSTGREDFSLAWLERQAELSLFAPQDIQATLLELTAVTVSTAVLSHKKNEAEVYCCGGGALNTQLLKRLTHHLSPYPVQTTDLLGIPPLWVEATAFAWLGYQTTHKKTSNLPSVTGARGKRILGAIYLA